MSDNKLQTRSFYAGLASASLTSGTCINYTLGSIELFGLATANIRLIVNAPSTVLCHFRLVLCPYGNAAFTDTVSIASQNSNTTYTISPDASIKPSLGAIELVSQVSGLGTLNTSNDYLLCPPYESVNVALAYLQSVAKKWELRLVQLPLTTGTAGTGYVAVTIALQAETVMKVN
jgi:hypothetical protein